MKFLSRLDDFEHIVIDGSVSGTGLSSLYLKDTATPILRIGNNTGDSFITYDGSELSISSDVDLRLTTPTDQDVFLITSSGNIVTTQAGGTFTIGGGLTLPAITGGFLKADANGVVSVDNSTYLTAETDTLDSVTGRGNTTTNSISVFDITTEDQINIKRAGVAAQTTLQQTGTGLVLNAPNGYHPLVIQHNGSELYRFTNTGNVGIGTTSPSAKLEINVSGAKNQLLLTQGSTDHMGLLAGTGGGGIIVEDNNFFSIWHQDYANRGTETGITERFRIDSIGNVGIGTTSPAYKLDIDAGGSQGAVNSRLTRNFGRARFHGVDIIGYDDEVMWIIGNNSSTNTELVIGNSWDWDRSVSFKYTPNATGLASGGLQIGQLSKNNANWTHGFTALHTNGSERLRIDSSGKVGIGTTSPDLKLHIAHSDSNNGLLLEHTSQASGYQILQNIRETEGLIWQRWTNGAFSANFMTLNYSGSLGVGTTDPQKRVHIRHDGNAPTGLLIQNLLDNNGTGDGDAAAEVFLNAASNNAYFRVHGAPTDSAADHEVEFGTTAGDAFFTFKPSGNERMRIHNDGTIQFNSYGAGLLQTDASGNVSVDTSTYLTSYTETQTLDDVTTLGATTTNNITVGEITGEKSVNGDVNFRFKNTSTGTSSAGNVWIYGEAYSTIRFTKTSTSSQRGNIVYDFANEAMGFRTNGVSNRLYINSSGNVGIGATDPLRKLHVVGDFSVNASTSQYYGVLINGGESSDPKITIGDWHNSSATIMWNSTSNHLVIDSQHSTSGAAIVFTGNDSATEYMRITGTGNVGIGTTSPQRSLHVEGGIITNTGASTTSYNPGVYVYEANGAYKYGMDLGRGNGRWRTRIIAPDGDKDISFAFAPGTTNSLQANYTDAMVIRGDSYNVGIGTTSPSSKLHIHTATGRSFQVDQSTANVTILKNDYELELRSGGGYDLKLNALGSSTFGSVTLRTNGSEVMRASSNGNVGIGTTIPGHKLHVYVADSNGFALDGLQEYTTMRFQYNGVSKSEFVRQNSNKHLYINNFESGGMMSLINNGNTSVRIDSSNNVGIGHDSPATNLHVVGTAETRLRVGSSNASSNVVLELVDENSPTTQGTVITYNNSTGETYFNNVYTPATTDFHFQSGAYGTATDFFSLSNAGGNSILHLSTVLGDAFITYENSTNEMELSSDGDLRLTTPTDQDVFFISSGGNIDMTQAGGTVDMGGNLVVDGDITGNSNAYIDGDVGIGTSSPQSKLEVLGNIDCLGSLINSDFGWEIFFGDSLFFFNGVNLLGALTSDGKLGIGTSFPTAKLEVDGSVRFSTITSGILSANASGDISATSASSLVQDNIYSPVGWKLTASTYTGGGQDITSSTTQLHSGTTPVTRTSSTVFTATTAGTYEVRYQFVIKNNYADRCIVGAQVKDTSGSIILGSRSFEYLRYTTYGEYNTIQATFYTTIDANNTFNLETALRSGSLNYTLESETGANAGYISFRLIKES